MKTDTHKKISTRIWSAVLDALDPKLERACLRRDAYIDRVLEIELAHLDDEISIPNTPVARKFIASSLDGLDRKLVTFTLRADLVERIEEICKRKNIVRDSFFNRMLFLLAAGPKTLDIVFSQLEEDWRDEVWTDYKQEGPVYQNAFYPLAPEINPFWALRTALELHVKKSEKLHVVDNPETGYKVTLVESLGHYRPPTAIYTTTLNNRTFKNRGEYLDLYGLNCYLADWEIPGSSEADEYNRTLIQDFDAFLTDN